MSGVSFAEVKRCVRVEQVLALLSWRYVRRNLHQLRGPCPIHKSSTSRSCVFSVNLTRDVWYCHKCKTGGDVIDLYARAKGISTHDAALELCAILNLSRGARVVAEYLRQGTEKRHGVETQPSLPLKRKGYDE